MTDFYLSAAGSDGGSGLFAAPWATLSRLNQAFSLGQVSRGDRVFLRRGDVFSGRLVLPDNINPALPGWLKVGAYGSGARPVIDGYLTLTSWTQHDADTWRTTIGTADPGFLKVDGVIHGRRRFTLAALTGQWDFHHEGTTLYVRSTANPTTLAGTVLVSVDQDGSNLRSGCELRNLHIRGHGAHGVNAPGLGGSTRARLLDCRLSELGGSTLDGFGNGQVRYGNGFQAWIGSQDVYVEGCEIHDCYDVALTLQGGTAGQTQTFDGITLRRNLTYRNSQSLEFWYGGDGAGFVNVLAERNTCLYAGYGWGATVRPEQESRVHLLTFAWGTAGPAVDRNVFYDAAGAFAFRSEATPGLTGTDNAIHLRAGTLMGFQQTDTVANGAAWATAAGLTGTRLASIPTPSATATDADVDAALAYLRTLSAAQVVTTTAGVQALPRVSPGRTP